MGDELPIACLGTAVVVEVELGGLLPGSHHKYVHAGHEVSCHKVPMPRGRDSEAAALACAGNPCRFCVTVSNSRGASPLSDTSDVAKCAPEAPTPCAAPVVSLCS